MTALNNSSVAFVFPGQGSQKVGMLAELAQHYPVIEQTFAEASQALGFDLWNIAQSGEKLDQTAYTQPVLLTASVAIWRAWRENNTILPVYLAGHSLGEYSALVAAEAISLQDAVKLVHLRGQLMQQAVAEGEGAMAAILGWDDAQVIELCQNVSKNAGVGQVDAANFNAKGQVVIAGTTQAVNVAIEQAKSQGAKAIVLPVSVPSHCSLMQDTAQQFAQSLNQIDWQLPKIPVIHNVNVQVANNTDELKQALTEQLYKSVQWTQTLSYLEQHGIQYLVECGAGNVLSNLAKRLPFVQQVLPLDTPSRFGDAVNHLQHLKG
ncbi:MULTISPECIES: ACP S-malonyltransferase [unclassified Acinetobacter]|uniref:ACP S-malonyltransferase n=1 Tax=unclassified Acinetobacter TaxID=196816 RepID=UPI0035B982F8